MIGLLAVAALDDVLDGASWTALRALAESGRFEAPARLLDSLDLFGVALAVAALAHGKTPAYARALLRRVSGVDAVLDKVVAAGAEVRYRRVLDAVAQLEALAVSAQLRDQWLPLHATTR